MKRETKRRGCKPPDAKNQKHEAGTRGEALGKVMQVLKTLPDDDARLRVIRAVAILLDCEPTHR